MNHRSRPPRPVRRRPLAACCRSPRPKRYRRAKILPTMKGMGAVAWRLPEGILLAGALALVACGAPDHSATISSPPSRSPISSPAANADDAAVVAAYRSATAAFVHAGQTMNPDDPALLATMSGQELSTVTKNLLIDKAGGLVARGDVTLTDPHVVANDGQTATLRDCQYSGILLVDAKTGQGAPGVANGPQDIAITATFVFTNGVWKESQQDGKVGPCPIGY